MTRFHRTRSRAACLLGILLLAGCTFSIPGSESGGGGGGSTRFTISVSGTPAAGGEFYGFRGSFAAGTTVLVHASPSFGYGLSFWSDSEGAVLGTANPLPVLVEGPVSLVGHFAPLPIPPPRIGLPGGIYDAPQLVALSTTAEGAVLRYTTDGTDPTESSGEVYADPVPVEGPFARIRAIACRPGIATSPVAAVAYSFRVPRPTFSLVPRAYLAPQSLELSSSIPGGRIRYTTDRTAPGEAAGTEYDGPIPVDSSMWVRALAYSTGWVTSHVSTRSYAISHALIASGSEVSVALTGDGSAWSWGWNWWGALGDGTDEYYSRYFPARVAGVAGGVSLSSTYGHTLVLRGDGTVCGWGGNWYGQLGDGTTNDQSSPVTVPGLGGVVAVAAGETHSLALLGDGTLLAWGDNGVGQLGDGTLNDRFAPGPVPGIDDVVAVVAGGKSSLALRGDGTVWGWGANNAGQLGMGNTYNRVAPERVPGMEDVVAISHSGGHALALRSDGTVWGWGMNSRGQLGDGSFVIFRLYPDQLSGLTGVVDIAAGGDNSFAVKADGTVWGCGDDYANILGAGVDQDQALPIQVSGFSGVKALFPGGGRAFAVKGDGTVWAWGQNSGLLGCGDYDTHDAPVQVLPLR